MLVYSPKTLRNEIGISERTYFRWLKVLKSEDENVRSRIVDINHKKNWSRGTYMTVREAFTRFGELRQLSN